MYKHAAFCFFLFLSDGFSIEKQGVMQGSITPCSLVEDQNITSVSVTPIPEVPVLPEVLEVLEVPGVF